MKVMLVLTMMLVLFGCAEPTALVDDEGRYLFRVYEARAILESNTVETTDDYIDLMKRVDVSSTGLFYVDLVLEATKGFASERPTWDEMDLFLSHVKGSHFACAAELLIEADLFDHEQIILITRTADGMNKFWTSVCLRTMKLSAQKALANPKTNPEAS